MYRHFFLTPFAFINWHTLILLYCMCYFICMHILVTTSYLLSISLLFYLLYNFILQTNFAQISSSPVSDFFKKILIFQWWVKAWLYLWFTKLLVNQSAPSALGCIPWGLMDLSMTSLPKYSLNRFSYNSMSSLFQVFSLASASMESFWRLVLLVRQK